MQAENLIFDDGSEWNIVEEIGEHSPRSITSILLHTLVIEPIDLRNSPRLMIAPCEMNTLRISNLQSHKQRYSFHWIISSIDKVTHKQVVSERHVSSYRKELNEVVQLSVNVSTNSNWYLDWSRICLLQEDSSGFLSDKFYLFFSNWFETLQVVYNHIQLSLIPHLQW